MTNKRLLAIAGAIAAGAGVVLGAAGWLLAWHSLAYVGLASLGTGIVWLVCARFTHTEALRPVHRRYLREFFPAIAAYVVLLFIAIALLDFVHSTALTIVVALLPVLPMVWLMRAVMHFLMDSDELEQKQQLQAIAIAAMCVGLLSFAAAFLRRADVLPLDNALMWVLPAMFAIYGIAMAWLRRGYRGQ